MVQWTEKPAPREMSKRGEHANTFEPLPVVRKKPTPRNNMRTMLGVALIVAIGATIPAGYFLFARTAPAPQAVTQEQADRELITGRIIISDQSGCRERGFNNHNGQSVSRGAIDCGSLVPRSQGLPERLDTIRKSFAPQ